MRSLRSRLSLLTLCCIALVLLPFLVLAYLKVVEEVDELSDARLAQNARTIEALAEGAGLSGSAVPADGPLQIEAWQHPGGRPAAGQGHPYEIEVGFQYWKNPSTLRMTTPDLRDLGFDAAAPGFVDVKIARRRWRVFTLIGRDGAFVRAAERYDSRREIARQVLWQNAAPLLLGLPLLGLMVGWAVRRGLRPLADVARRLEARSPDATAPIGAQDAPLEIEPLVRALNGLLQRLRGMLDSERQFTANAAHELRTPLAGALVHLGNAEAGASEEERAAALHEARGALERMTHIVNQMLDLARWDAATRAKAFAEVDLARCIDDALLASDLAIVDSDTEIVRSIDERASRVQGWEPGLRTLLRNLIDNALRYGGAHGRIEIDVASRGGRTLLAVSDRGPGIPAAQRAAMLERFRRGAEVKAQGSGLGLSIVARIAELHGATLNLTEPPDRQGLRVEVLFARIPRPTARDGEPS
jgi:two-component system sensor histidine kinase QseC